MSKSMPVRAKSVVRRISKLFPLISATLLILLAYQNCGQARFTGEQILPHDPLVYKIDVDSKEIPKPILECADPSLSTLATVDVTELFFPSGSQPQAQQDSWELCANRVQQLMTVQAFLLRTAMDDERDFAIKVIRESFPHTPILIVYY